MFLVYGDDSADQKKERVCAVGVVAGTEVMWEALEPKWIACNDGIPFHARDCESDRGDYAHFAHERNKALYREVTTMLAESGLGGLGIAIDLAAQRKIFPGSLDLSYYKAFMEVLDRTKMFAVRDQQRAKFTFDVSTQNEYNADFLYASVRENDPEASALFDAEISFVSARDNPRVQTGDLMAFEAMKALDNTIGPTKRKRRSWEALRATERFDVFAYGEEWFADLKRQLGNLEDQLGCSRQDYVKWLKEKKRQHSTSSLFHFTHWKWKEERQITTS